MARRHRRLLLLAAIVALFVWRQRMLAANEERYGWT
jgi:hypothetical protein